MNERTGVPDLNHVLPLHFTDSSELLCFTYKLPNLLSSYALGRTKKTKTKNIQNNSYINRLWFKFKETTTIGPTKVLRWFAVGERYHFWHRINSRGDSITSDVIHPFSVFSGAMSSWIKNHLSLKATQWFEEHDNNVA